MSGNEFRRERGEAGAQNCPSGSTPDLKSSPKAIFQLVEKTFNSCQKPGKNLSKEWGGSAGLFKLQAGFLQSGFSQNRVKDLT